MNQCYFFLYITIAAAHATVEAKPQAELLIDVALAVYHLLTGSVPRPDLLKTNKFNPASAMLDTAASFERSC
jgi:hypothetical protein